MYIDDRQLRGDEAWRRGGHIIVRPSQRFYYPVRRQLQRPFSPLPGLTRQHSYRLGEAVAAPRGLKLLDHFHAPKRPDPRVPGGFITGLITRMAASDMNPGFIDASDNLITDPSSNGLQTCLQKLITHGSLIFWRVFNI